MATSKKSSRKARPSNSSTDRTDEAIDWLNSAGGELIELGAEPEDVVGIAKDAVLDRWPSATFREEELLAAAQDL